MWNTPSRLQGGARFDELASYDVSCTRVKYGGHQRGYPHGNAVGNGDTQWPRKATRRGESSFPTSLYFLVLVGIITSDQTAWDFVRLVTWCTSLVTWSSRLQRFETSYRWASCIPLSGSAFLRYVATDKKADGNKRCNNNNININ